MTETGNNAADVILILFFFFFILLLLGGCCGGGYYYHQCKKNQEPFANVTGNYSNHQNNNYNSLYTDKYKYTQPAGDTKAQEYGHSGQGTKGEFLPIQGLQAGTFMKNSAMNNHILPSPDKGQIGGQPNYTEKEMTTSWIGFNNFPLPIDNPDNLSNSYLLQGANERVCNPGQKCDNLPAPNWWPTVKKDNKGYAVQGSDLLVTCNSVPKNINNCQEGNQFVRYKNEPEYKKVYDN